MKQLSRIAEVNRKRLRRISVGFLGAVIAVFVLFLSGRWGTAVCVKCGEKSRSSQLSLGMGYLPFLTLKSERSETPLSQFVGAQMPEICTKHNWAFAAGGNFTVVLPAKSCAIGGGRHLWQATDSTNVVNFLQARLSDSGKPVVERWIQRLLDPKLSRDAMWSIEALEIYREPGMSDQEAAETAFSQVFANFPASSPR